MSPPSEKVRGTRPRVPHHIALMVDARIGKANPVLRKIYRSVATKRELSNTAKLSVFKSIFVPILTYGHESWEMTEIILAQVQASKMLFLQTVHGVTKARTEVRLRSGQETSLALLYLNLSYFGIKCLGLKKKLNDIVEAFPRPLVIRRPGHCVPLVTPLVWHFATKCAVVKFAVPWMSNHFCLREYNYFSSATYPECPTDDWWGKLAKPTGKRPRCRPRPRCSNCISDLAWTRRGVEQAELSEIAVDR